VVNRERCVQEGAPLFLCYYELRIGRIVSYIRWIIGEAITYEVTLNNLSKGKE